MSVEREFTLSGKALPADARRMLDEMREHFVEHADVERTQDGIVLRNGLGTARIRVERQALLIELSCVSQEALQISRTSLAEHMFYFAGDEPFRLDWEEPVSSATLPNLHEATVVSTENVTPHMRRVKFACADVTPFVGGDMHVRLLVPPPGRPPVWPGYREDGRIAWPEGENALLVRVYTIRAVDAERGEVWIDFLQHPMPGVATPGADFARDARPGQKVGFLGPGGGGLPPARSILMIGDESALPAIARIAAEVPPGTRLQAVVEVEDAKEEQPLASHGALTVRWLHRKDYPDGAKNRLAEEAKKAISSADGETFIWVACEKEDIRSVRSFLKGQGRDKHGMYVAWYWERSVS